MKIAVVTLFPELVEAFAAHGIPRIAVEQGKLTLYTVNPRDFTDDPHRTVDDRPYGGGPGMLMRAEPLQKAIHAAQHKVGMVAVSRVEKGAPASLASPVEQTVYLSPQGRGYTQGLARQVAGVGDESSGIAALVLVAGRYEGIDERVIEQSIDQEWSVGDYVLSGGEPAALSVIDSIARLLPGVLGNSESAENDSFGSDGLLDCPHYTRPAEFGGESVPEVLLSGDHGAIEQWRRRQSLLRTATRRPDLLEQASDNGSLSREDAKFLREAGIEY